jgi:hypothetical protein
VKQLALALVVAATGASASAAQASVVTALPVSDTYVDASAPGSAFGRARLLKVGRSPARRIYLRFRMPELAGAPVAATLRLTVGRASTGRVAVRRLSTDARWSERRATWRRSPAPVGPAVRSPALRGRDRVDVDVTGLVGRGGRIDLVLTGRRQATFASRERARPARLLVRLAEHGAKAPVFTPGPIGPPAVPPVESSLYPIRGVFERDASATGFDEQAALSFNVIDSNAYPEELDPLAARGLKGFVWLGGYSPATCDFNRTDDWITERVKAIADNPAIAGYLIDDEPDVTACPTAPAQMKARSDLVKTIDPGPPTFLVVYRVEQFEAFAGTVDVLAADRYPCSIQNGCDFSKIDAAIAELDRLGVRYWGVVQAHGDDWYRAPTPAELHEEFEHWRASRMEGYLVFSWRWPPAQPELWLANDPDLQAQLALENRTPRPSIP